MQRRALLGLIGSGALGGIAYTSNNEVKTTVNGAISGAGSVATPETDTMIRAENATKYQTWNDGETTMQSPGIVKRIEFYQSGAAIVKPQADHGCFDGFALLHESMSMGYNADGSHKRSEALSAWRFGDFDEPVTIDMGNAIAAKSNYPSQQFKIVPISYDSSCVGGRMFMFRAPNSMMP